MYFCWKKTGTYDWLGMNPPQLLQSLQQDFQEETKKMRLF